MDCGAAEKLMQLGSIYADLFPGRLALRVAAERMEKQ
jgi:hypothetical protein